MAKNKKRKRQGRKKRRSQIKKPISECKYSAWRLLCITILIVMALIAFVSIFGDGGYDSAYLGEIKRKPLLVWPGTEWRVLADMWGYRAARYMRLQMPVGNIAGLLVIFGFATLIANNLNRRLHRAVVTVAVLMIASGAYFSIGANCAGGSNTSASITPTPQPGVVYFLDDHQGNTHLVTDSVGNVVHEESRYPYGVKKHEQNSADNSEAVNESKPYYSYTGKEYDEETGLIYFGGRYYSPELGRWITPDPLPLNEIRTMAIKPPTLEDGLGTLQAFTNLYSYVENNPVSRIDPDGFKWEYSQSAGQMTHIDDQTKKRSPISVGYSGYQKGLNNPDMQHAKSVGPIPRGHWKIEDQRNSPNTGTGVIDLNPEPDAETFGRKAFQIHGDNSRGDNSASRGCIIMPRKIRDQINDSQDRVLEVIK